MINSFRLCCIVLTFIVSVSTGQKILQVFKSQGSMSDFNATSVGDSILLSYDEWVSDNHVKRSFWITDSVRTNDLVPVEVFTAAEFGNEVYLYFLNGKGKSKELKALVSNLRTKSRTESTSPLRLPGTYLGSYMDKNLFLLMLDPDGVQLSILEINGLTVVSQKKFNLPLKLADYITRGSPVDLFPAQLEANTFRGRAKVKIFKYDKIYITVDQEDLAGGWTQPSKGAQPVYDETIVNGTLVITLDLTTSQLSSFSIASSAKGGFSSFILDEKLFRTSTGKKKFSLAIFDIQSKEIIATSELLPEQPDVKVYFRYGRKNVIHERETFSNMMKVSPACDPTLVVTKNNGKYIIQWGTYFNQNGMVGPGSLSMGMAGALAVMVVGTMIRQAMEGPGVSRYFYYEWDDQQNTFKVRAPSLQSVREKIDHFEIDHRIRYAYKNYIQYKDGVAGIYYDSKAKTAWIVSFN